MTVYSFYSCNKSGAFSCDVISDATNTSATNQLHGDTMSKWDKKRSGHANEGRPQKQEGDGSSSDEDNEISEPVSIGVRICLWEFGQNDPKRLVPSQMVSFHLHYSE